MQKKGKENNDKIVVLNYVQGYFYRNYFIIAKLFSVFLELFLSKLTDFHGGQNILKSCKKLATFLSTRRGSGNCFKIIAILYNKCKTTTQNVKCCLFHSKNHHDNRNLLHGKSH